MSYRLQLICVVTASFVAVSASGGTVPPFGQVITYQGELAFDGVPVTDSCDFRFDVWSADVGGDEIDGSNANSVPVLDGRFTAGINCTDGDCFNGEPRWLEIEVRCPAGAGDYTLLDPRQEVTPAPYAILAADVPPDSITSSEIADGTVQPADVDGGLFARKTQLYRRTETTSFASVATFIITAFCDDANDLPIGTGCQTSGPSRVRLVEQTPLSWDTEAEAAGFRCTYDNTLNFTSSITVEIYCLAVP